MPGRALGNQRESAVADDLDAVGYAVVPVKGSGARGAAMRRRNHAVIGDMLAIPVDRDARRPWFQVECGGRGKNISAAFAELRAQLLPGFTPLVVCWRKTAARATRAKRFFYTSPTERHETLEDALRAVSVTY